AIAFSPDGKLLASASRDRTARLWDVQTGKQIAALDGHRGGVYAVAFSPDGRTLASAGADRSILLWDVPAAGAPSTPLRERAEWTGHQASITCLAFSPDGTIVASGSAAAGKKLPGVLKLWDAATGKELTEWTASAGDVTALAFAARGAVLAVGDESGALKLWDVASRKLLAARKQRSAVRALAFSPDGKYLASGHAGSGLLLWDTTEWLEQAWLNGHQGAISSVAFAATAASSPFLVSTGQDKMFKLWSLEPRRLAVVRCTGHDGWVTAVAVSPDGRQLLSASWDGTLRLWDAATGKES